MRHGELRHAMRRRRRELGLTQYQVAYRMGTAQSEVSNLEIGRTPNPGIITVTRWAAALNLDLDLGMKIIPEQWGPDGCEAPRPLRHRPPVAMRPLPAQASPVSGLPAAG